jgi:hypothetical protein
MHQPTLVSPCLLGNPCSVCALHAHCLSGEPCKGCRKGQAHDCERAYPAAPAYALTIPAAIQLAKDGLAKFIHRSTALQLNFARLNHLRDQSCRVDAHLIWQYVVGIRRARLAVDLGWGAPSTSPYGQDSSSEVHDSELLSVEVKAIVLVEAVKHLEAITSAN